MAREGLAAPCPACPRRAAPGLAALAGCLVGAAGRGSARSEGVHRSHQAGQGSEGPVGHQLATATAPAMMCNRAPPTAWCLLQQLLLLLLARSPSCSARGRCCHSGKLSPCGAMLVQLCSGSSSSQATTTPSSSTNSCRGCATRFAGTLTMAGCADAEISRRCSRSCDGCSDLTNSVYCARSAEICEGKCKGRWCEGPSLPPAPPVPASFTLHNSLGGGSAGTVSESFVSFTLDLSNAKFRFKMLHFKDPAFIAVAKTYAPAYLRIGGTAEDNASYNMRPAAAAAGGGGGGSHRRGLNIHPVTLNKHLWDEVNHFAKEVGWKVVFGLNALAGWSDDAPSSSSVPDWDVAAITDFVSYTVAQRHPVVGWELGKYAPS